MKIYTIGFTQKSAQQFFQILANHHVTCLVDIRKHPDGQLAGFTKMNDLRYFLDKLIGCNYRHMPCLAPEDDILKAYRSDHNWLKYQNAFESLMDSRSIPEMLDKTLFEDKSVCFLCSEPTPEKCHRRLVAERLARSWMDIEIIHL